MEIVINQFRSLDHLRKLRQIKVAYRGELALPSGTNNVIEAWLEEISQAFGISLNRNKSLRAEEIVSSLKTKRFSSSYELLRSLEAAYHISRSHGYFHPEHERLMKHIQNPNGYGSSEVRKRGTIESYLDDIVEFMIHVQGRNPGNTFSTSCLL
ncbi:MAG: hypothetical protein JJU48_03410 [Methylophaga sp.]|nr:hypothetical protein [Methylophaga sp.]